MVLTVEHQPDDDLTLLRLCGDLDAFGVRDLRDAARAFRRGLTLLIDLTAVCFIDSAGIGALVGVVRRNRERGGRAALVVGGSVATVLRGAGMHEVVTLAQTIDVAKRELSLERVAP
jgi:anti-anti-sigma factor